MTYPYTVVPSPSRLFPRLALSALLLAAPIALTGCGAQAAGSANAPGMPDTITVSGHGEASAAPDQAEFRIGVTRVEPTASAAIGGVNEEVKKLIERLRKEGVPAECLQTQNLSVEPQEEIIPLVEAPVAPPPAPVATGKQAAGIPAPAAAPAPEPQPKEIRRTTYRAYNTLVVRVKDLSRLGVILGAGVEAGANSLGELSFSFQDSKKLDAQARMAAMQDAMEKARQLAEASGVRLGDVVLVVEDGGGPIGPGPYRFGAMAKAEAMPVEAGTYQVQQTVRVVYRIQR